jgi:hypothetical protein
MAEGAKERKRPADVDILLDPDRAETQVPRWTVSVPYLIAGVLLPVACFSLNWTPMVPKPGWQTPHVHEYVPLFLRGPATAYFYPLLVYSSVCMLMLTYWFRRFSRFFVVRLGVYTGIVLAAQYAVATGIMVVFGSAFGVASLLLPLAARALLRYWNRHESWGGRSSTVVFYVLTALLMVAAVVTGVEPRVWGIPLLFVLGSAPLWALLAFILMSMRLLREVKPEAQRWKAVGGTASWLSVYAASLGLSIRQAVNTYASLPKHDPTDCYVCTAAARGHAWFVGAVPVEMDCGETVLVNDQLRTLKLAEIAMRETAPRLHRAVRGVYDIIGPPAARMLAHPVLADLAYLSLKPAEWLARLALGLVVGLVVPGFRGEPGNPTPPAASVRAAPAPQAPRPAAPAGAGGARTPPAQGGQSRP